jgi:hypothetical protein
VLIFLRSVLSVSSPFLISLFPLVIFSFLSFFSVLLNTPGQERGMKSLGLTQFRLKHQLQEWLQLSTQKKIPISLLIMSRAFSLTESDEPEDILRSSMSSLDSDTINEVVVAAASAGEEKTVDMQKRKLESLRFQEEVRRSVLCCGVFSLTLSLIVFFHLSRSVVNSR